MRLGRLWLTDFRCYASAEVAFADGCTVITGANGQGKTSLLEAVGWRGTCLAYAGLHLVVTLPLARFAIPRESRRELVAPQTDPSWVPLFVAAVGVVVNVGAMGSHAMIVSRELGVPCVASVANATDIIPNGATVTVDGNAGTVTIIALPD